MTHNRREGPRWHGGTLGDRFADQGHAEHEQGPMSLQGGNDGGRHPASRSCVIQLGVAAMVAVALLTVPFLPLRSAVRR